MSLHFNIYAIVLLASGIAAAMVGFVLLQRRHSAIVWFSIMMLVSAVWAIAYAFELSSATIEQMLFLINFEYLGVAFLPAIWIMFVLHFIQKRKWLTPVNITLIFMIPVITMLMVITNSYHNLHYLSTSLNTSGPFPLLMLETGPWYTVHTVFFYALMALGMFLLARHFRQFDKFYRKQTIIILAGAFIPWITNLIYLLGLRPHSHIDLTPYAFIITALVIAFGLSRYRLFDIVPFAREKLIENLNEGMLVLDEHGRIIDLNSTMQKFLSSYSTVLMGNKLPEVLSTHTVIQHLLLREGNHRAEIQLSNGNEYEVSATRLQDKQKRFAGTLLIFWDITNRKKTTALLQAQANELRELNELKNQMFSIIAHDLKSPMAGLNSLLKLAESGAFSEQELKDILPLLSRNVDNTSILLNNLLNWARSQLAGEHIDPELFILSDIVKRNIILLEKRALEKGIRISNQCDPGMRLFADRDMIDLVLRNLISNAIKFCDSNDSITIRADAQDGYTTVQVRDTGMGMDEHTQAKLFQLTAFSRPGTKNEKGTGLGLKLCKDFIEKNNGTLRVESKPGSGSTFFFRLPNTEHADV